MDAIVGMEGDGPSNGNPRKIGLVLASKSCTALDYVAVTIAGFDPMSVPTVKLAHERGVGPARLEDIQLFGEVVEPLIMGDFEKTSTTSLSRAPPFLVNSLKRFIAAKPVVNASKCIRCGECFKDCPPKAITFAKAAGPTIDYGKCIRCYCCQELCPEGAITVSTPVVRRLLKR
jgi:ferredoxin